MLRVVGAGPSSELAKTLEKFSGQKDILKKELAKFISYKSQHPVNGSIPGKVPGYGDSDKKFRSGGNFDNRLPNLAHAHLTHNLSIVYYVDRENNALRLYGIYSHDDIGTGNPPSINRQVQASSRWANMKFDPAEQPISLQVDPNKKLAKPGTKVDYTPKPKVAQPQPTKPTAPVEADRTLQFANEIDKVWPNRNFFNKLRNAQTKQDKLNVITDEISYLNYIRKKNALYPNQQLYLRGLDAIFKYLSMKK